MHSQLALGLCDAHHRPLATQQAVAMSYGATTGARNRRREPHHQSFGIDWLVSNLHGQAITAGTADAVIAAGHNHDLL